MQVKPKLGAPLTKNSSAQSFSHTPPKRGQTFIRSTDCLFHSNLDTTLLISIIIFSYTYAHTLPVPPNKDLHSTKRYLSLLLPRTLSHEQSTSPRHHGIILLTFKNPFKPQNL